MNFNLDRDLVFFDIESTGLHVMYDRIIQLAMIKYKPSGETERLELLINPGKAISKEAELVHGITDEQVADKPTFKEVAVEVFDFVGDADLAGYNSNRFDIPILLEELSRCGLYLDMTTRRTVDVQQIFHKMEPRTLKAAYRFYCGQELENAHDAMSDVEATVQVLQGQLEKYQGVDAEIDGDMREEPIKNDMQALHEISTDIRVLDATQKLKKNPDGVVVFNFGRYNGAAVGETLFKDQQYYQWMLNKDFSYQVKDIIKKEYRDYAESQR